MTISIKSQNLILVEGKDEENFFDCLLKELGINSIQIISASGKTKFPEELPKIKKLSNFKMLKKIAIVQDADGDFQSAIDSINGILRNNKLPATDHNKLNGKDIKTSLFIMPGVGFKKPFMLEELFIESVKNTDAMNCVENFINCIEEKRGVIKENKLPKVKTQVFLSSLNSKKIPNSIGLAAKQGYIDFSNTVFDELKSFINKMK